MEFFQTALIIATFLCSLIAGFLFAFAVVVMPGIRRLNDHEFIRTFQLIDGIIQNHQPVFILVWLGSVVAIISSAALSIGRLDGASFFLMCFVTFTYLFGVQLPTFTINVPMNNKLQTLNVDEMNETELEETRAGFELRWNQWNIFRAAVSSIVSVLLIILLFIL